MGVTGFSATVENAWVDAHFHMNVSEVGSLLREVANVTFHGSNTFLANSAGYGGGAEAWDSDVRFSGIVIFRDNTAYQCGGGIHSRNSNISILDTSDIIVENNVAQYGGGVILQDSNITISGDITVRNNMAVVNGGGFSSYFNNIRLGDEIKIPSNKIYITGSMTVENNMARDGGGILLRNIDIIVSGDITVKNNTAKIGGGIHLFQTVLNVFGDITVTSNMAQGSGGGMYSWGSRIDSSGNMTIRDNMAQENGGGITLVASRLILAGNNKFAANSARQLGGGIYAPATNIVDFDGMNAFIANRADISGGGIWVSNSTLKLDGSNYFEECTARYDGGGIFSSGATVILPGNNKFLSNSATLRGGGISARWSHLSFTNSSKFSKNVAETGGGIFTDNSTLDFGGFNTIESNFADLGGGIYMINSSLDFLGYNSFILNSATQDGGGIYARENGIIYLSGSNNFQGNTAAERGGGVFIKDSNLISWTVKNISTSNATTHSVQRILKLPSRSEFCKNTAMTGGGLYSIDSILDFHETYTLNFTANTATNAGGGFATIGSTINITGSMAFETNSAMSGGGMYLEDTKVNWSGRNYFNRNHAHYEGGAVYVRASKVNLSGADRFVSNSAAMRGGSISATCTNLTFRGTTTIQKSTSQQGGAIYVMGSSIVFECATELKKNSAQYGGAVLSEISNVSFGKPCREYQGRDNTHHPSSRFINNTALWGGAVHLDHHSSVRFYPSASALFSHNKATEYGGAIFVVDTVGQNTCPPVMYLPSRNECFFHVISNEISQTENINLTFEGNTAGKGGSVLYGGMLNKCNYSYSGEYTDTVDLFNRSITHGTHADETAAISSDPMMCFCSEGGSPQCVFKVQNETPFPGQKVNVSIVALDQTYTPTQTDIHSDLISDEKHKSRVCESFSEEREGSCTNRSYTITSPRTSSKLLLYPTTASGNPIPAVLNVTFRDCPIGFEQSNSNYECICDHRLQKFTNTCDIETQTLLRTGRLNGTFWVNASFNNNGTLDGYIHHLQCPLNYCTKQQRHIDLSNPDEQCDFNHAGLLCGKCKENFSLILGSFRCKECSSGFLALLILFALAGVALVILLFSLKLTVAAGTLQGLIFYVNIVAANHHIFFPPDAHILARIFIGWLNLDLGIETCFYNGMDAYSKSWLQIVFPLYIWGIVGFLIFISKRSQRVTQLLGTNPVAVLDTLFLLSYTKLLRTTITALSLTILHYPQKDSIVWLYDASIPIPKLIPFFIAASMFLVFLFLPYTLLLLLGQWLWNKSDYCSCWEKYPRLKLGLSAILDPYHAPYKPKHCYWTGLLLLLRCVLLLVSAFNISGEKDSVNLLAILSTVVGALTVFGLSGRVYKSWYLNALEVSFLLNLRIVTAATYHVRLVNGDQAVVTHISVGVAFLTFVGIIIYHINLNMKWKLQHLPHYLRMIKRSGQSHRDENKINAENSNLQNPQETQPRAPTTTVVDLRSPLDLIDADCD